MLLDKYDSIPKVTDSPFKTSVDDNRNGKKTPTQVAIATKRYSIDNYCSNWLSNTCKPSHHEQSDNVSEQNTFFASNQPTNNGHGNNGRALEVNKLQHRRSLSENIIPFPPHTTPSDKARCHLINRRNSHLNASSGCAYYLRYFMTFFDG